MDGSRKVPKWFLWSLAVVGLVVVAMLIAIPTYIRRCCGSSPSELSCRANLGAIASAKEDWALEHKAPSESKPLDADLFGTNKYYRLKPICPEAGNYTIGAVGEKPRCSIPGHTI